MFTFFVAHQAAWAAYYQQLYTAQAAQAGQPCKQRTHESGVVVTHNNYVLCLRVHMRKQGIR